MRVGRLRGFQKTFFLFPRDEPDSTRRHEATGRRRRRRREELTASDRWWLRPRRRLRTRHTDDARDTRVSPRVAAAVSCYTRARSARRPTMAHATATSVPVLVVAAACLLLMLPPPPPISAAASGFRFTVLHTNDAHSNYDATARGHGGFARLRTALLAERARAAADGAPAVHLYAGDTFFGTPFYDVLGWEPAADLVGGLGVDAMTLGNHEFHSGPRMLAPFLKSNNMSHIPIVCTNINTEEEPSLTNIRPSTVLSVGGRNIGVVGYLTPDTTWLNEVGKVKITDEIQSVKTEVAKLKNAGAEFIIALGHSGLEMDRRVAREVDGVDVIVGGHSHSYLINGAPQDTEDPVGPYPIIEKRGEQIVPVVQAYAFTKYLGKLVLTFDSEKRLISAAGGPILLDKTISQDAETAKKVEYYKHLLIEKQRDQVIGKTYVFLDGDSTCKETNLGNVIADSFVRFNLKNNLNNNVTLSGWTDAAIAITISSSIKHSINASNTQGDIFLSEIKSLLPYSTPLCKITVTGTTLLKALEHSASTLDHKKCAVPEKKIFGGFIQLSGIQVVYNSTNAVGSRVQSVMIKCSECQVPKFEPINPNKQYTLITTKYLIEGGDMYTMIKNGIINVVYFSDVSETDAFQMYIEEMSPIYSGIDNRIIIIH